MLSSIELSNLCKLGSLEYKSVYNQTKMGFKINTLFIVVPKQSWTEKNWGSLLSKNKFKNWSNNKLIQLSSRPSYAYFFIMRYNVNLLHIFYFN